MSSNNQQQQFGELILLIGDLHIPDRRPLIPPAFDKLLNTDRISHVLCTGNIGNPDTLERLRNISKNFHVVRGDMDIDSPDCVCDFPESKSIEICGYRIGLVHGHQIVPKGRTEALAAWQRKLDCDILVTGFTHQNSAEKIVGRMHINPGSATGASNPSSPDPIIPSFMLMSIEAAKVVLYVYELKDRKVHVATSQFTK